MCNRDIGLQQTELSRSVASSIDKKNQLPTILLKKKKIQSWSKQKWWDLLVPPSQLWAFAAFISLPFNSPKDNQFTQTQVRNTEVHIQNIYRTLRMTMEMNYQPKTGRIYFSAILLGCTECGYSIPNRVTNKSTGVFLIMTSAGYKIFYLFIWHSSLSVSIHLEMTGNKAERHVTKVPSRTCTRMLQPMVGSPTPKPQGSPHFFIYLFNFHPIWNISLRKVTGPIQKDFILTLILMVKRY